MLGSPWALSGHPGFCPWLTCPWLACPWLACPWLTSRGRVERPYAPSGPSVPACVGPCTQPGTHDVSAPCHMSQRAPGRNRARDSACFGGALALVGGSERAPAVATALERRGGAEDTPAAVGWGGGGGVVAEGRRHRLPRPVPREGDGGRPPAVGCPFYGEDRCKVNDVASGTDTRSEENKTSKGTGGDRGGVFADRVVWTGRPAKVTFELRPGSGDRVHRLDVRGHSWRQVPGAGDKSGGAHGAGRRPW